MRGDDEPGAIRGKDPSGIPHLERQVDKDAVHGPREIKAGAVQHSHDIDCDFGSCVPATPAQLGEDPATSRTPTLWAIPRYCGPNPIRKDRSLAPMKMVFSGTWPYGIHLRGWHESAFGTPAHTPYETGASPIIRYPWLLRSGRIPPISGKSHPRVGVLAVPVNGQPEVAIDLKLEALALREAVAVCVEGEGLYRGCCRPPGYGAGLAAQ